MTAEQWRRARELFEAAIDAPPVDIAGWLSAQSRDEVVRREVASLLSHHSRAGGFLTEPLGDLSALFEDSPEFAAGDQLGPYLIEREAGRGGMGRVYRAVDTRLNRTVAIKALPRELAPDPAQRERLRREARAAAALSHPGICTVFALEEFDGALYIVSEFIDGRTLHEEIAESHQPAGRLPSPARVLDTARQLAAALASAHAAGITHRDLKPENVMRNAEGRIKVLDFGLARQPVPASGVASLVTQAGTVIGTPAYMAPEQLNGEPADPRTDVFAFGLLLSEYATGRHPFEAPTTLARLGRVLAAPPDPLTVYRDDLPPGLLGALARCLAKPPGERFASAIDLLGALPGSDTSSGATPLTPPTFAGSDGARWWRVHQVVVVGLYFVAAVLAWFVKEVARGGASAIFIAIGVLGTIVGMLRGHLLFTERTHGAGFPRERGRLATLTAVGDLLIALLLAADGLTLVNASRELAGVLTIAWAAAIAVARVLIEPATARAAFGGET